MMSRYFTWFPIGGYRRTQYIPRFGGVLQETGKVVKKGVKYWDEGNNEYDKNLNLLSTN